MRESHSCSEKLVELSGWASSLKIRTDRAGNGPQNYTNFSQLESWDVQVYAERDGADAKLHGKALKRFISGWRQTRGDRRLIKEVSFSPVLVYQSLSSGSDDQTISTTRTRQARSRADYLHHSMLLPQIGGGFSRL